MIVLLFALAALAQTAVLTLVLTRWARRTEWEAGGFAGLLDDLAALEARAPVETVAMPRRRTRDFTAGPAKRLATSRPRLEKAAA